MTAWTDELIGYITDALKRAGCKPHISMEQRGYEIFDPRDPTNLPFFQGCYKRYQKEPGSGIVIEPIGFGNIAGEEQQSAIQTALSYKSALADDGIESELKTHGVGPEDITSFAVRIWVPLKQEGRRKSAVPDSLVREKDQVMDWIGLVLLAAGFRWSRYGPPAVSGFALMDAQSFLADYDRGAAFAVLPVGLDDPAECDRETGRYYDALNTHGIGCDLLRTHDAKQVVLVDARQEVVPGAQFELEVQFKLSAFGQMVEDPSLAEVNAILKVTWRKDGRGWKVTGTGKYAGFGGYGLTLVKAAAVCVSEIANGLGNSVGEHVLYDQHVKIHI